MSKKLQDITGEWENVYEMLIDDEVDEQMIFDTLENIEGEFEDKADNYAKIIKELDFRRDFAKAEAKRQLDRTTIFDNRAKRLKQNLFNAMKQTGKTKFATDLFSFSIVKNGGFQKIILEGEVPEEFTKTIIEIDMEKIRETLRVIGDLPFAHLESRGESLRIK